MTETIDNRIKWEYQIINDDGDVDLSGPYYILIDDQEVERWVSAAKSVGLPVHVAGKDEQYSSGTKLIDKAPDGKRYIAIVFGSTDAMNQFNNKLDK